MKKEIAVAKEAAIEALLHNLHGPYQELPRTAGWGYPEPYTRDLMISSLGMLVSGNKELIKALDKVFLTLVKNQSHLGYIASLIHNPEDVGASDTTPLFLLASNFYQQATGNKKYLAKSVKKALRWMEYRNPCGRPLVVQMPTTDWRDEQWVLGFGLYVNTLVYSYLKAYKQKKKAAALRGSIEHHKPAGKPRPPYYPIWFYKVYQSDRFDLLGNSLAILSGLASPDKAARIISWIESSCRKLKKQKLLGVDLPPNLMPYIWPGDDDWRPRYKRFNLPGEYHNGGIWPFICGFYIAALVAAKKYRLAERKLEALTRLVKPARQRKVAYGFNEWFRAQDGTPQGQDWQTWSAAMYLYAAECVEKKKTPFFESLRS
jgi:hypothetical protein